jgi:hypothetical protein
VAPVEDATVVLAGEFLCSGDRCPAEGGTMEGGRFKFVGLEAFRAFK